eukprot:2423217-Rhodomonas_salina.3
MARTKPVAINSTAFASRSDILAIQEGTRSHGRISDVVRRMAVMPANPQHTCSPSAESHTRCRRKTNGNNGRGLGTAAQRRNLSRGRLG